MVKIENDCVGCPPEMGCLGSSCPYRDVPHYYCDDCGCEDDTFYRFNSGWGEDTDKIYCKDHVLNHITTEMIDAYFEQDNFYEEDDIKYFYYIVLHNRFALDGSDDYIISHINDDEYKIVRDEYLKNGDVKKGIKFLDDICDLDEFLHFVCEVE